MNHLVMGLDTETRCCGCVIRINEITHLHHTRLETSPNPNKTIDPLLGRPSAGWLTLHRMALRPAQEIDINVFLGARGRQRH